MFDTLYLFINPFFNAQSLQMNAILVIGKPFTTSSCSNCIMLFFVPHNEQFFVPSANLIPQGTSLI